MDIYRFIDSKDIREYLENLNYSFSTWEAAYIVWHCKNATVSEKEDTWNRIIETMPNCALQKRINMIEIPDFHAFLKKYIDVQKLILQNFIIKDNCIYSFTVRYRNKNGNKDYYESDVFSDYTKCLDACIDKMSILHCNIAEIEKRHIHNDFRLLLSV